MNYPPGTGYAWGTIEAVMRQIATLESGRGGTTIICFPPGGKDPAPGSKDLSVVRFDAVSAKSNWAAAIRFARWLAAQRVDVLYLTDHPTWSFRYFAYRLAGVRAIIVHDRTSGARHSRIPALAPLKRLLHRFPGLAGDRFIGVSDFVAKRLVETNGTPRSRTIRVYNGIDLARFEGPRGNRLHDLLGLEPETPVVFASGRAMPYKGFATLIEAAAMIEQSGGPKLHIAYAGDGPGLASLKALAAERELKRFHFLGKRDDVPSLLRSATIAVVPSAWEEAFGLTVAEAMAAGLPLIATKVGGIPELVDPGQTGLLVPPNDPEGLSRAIATLVGDREMQDRFSTQARKAARERFSIERVATEIHAVVCELRSIDHLDSTSRV